LPRFLLLIGLILWGCRPPEPRQAGPGTTPLPPIAKPPERPDTLRFLALGDWGYRGAESQREVAQAMTRYADAFHPDFIVSTGDNFYDHGVESTTDSHWRESFERVYTGRSLQVPWYAVLGNHDYPRSPEAQVEYTRQSTRWRMPARYYTTAVRLAGQPTVRLVYLDTNPMMDAYRSNPALAEYREASRQDPIRQRRWLDSVLTAAPEPWKLVVGHHPIYTAGLAYRDAPELIRDLKPILQKHHVQVYLCGHEHNLQHSRVPGEGIDYLLSGGGGSWRYAGTNERTQFSASARGFVAISVRTDSLFVEFIDHEGKRLYGMKRGRQ
jgi:tartrate-resistant acid phosphatase type 5